MIASLKGEIAAVQPGIITLQVGPVGLEVLVPGYLQGDLRVGSKIEMVIHTHVSDDAITLYGFNNLLDRDFYRKLLSVNGVGPKSALAILAIDPDDVKQAILKRDLDTLGTIPGLGKKRAQRLILELGNALTEDEAKVRKGGKKTKDHPLSATLEPALVKLGYSKDEISTMISNLPDDVDEPEAALQYILKNA